VRSAAIPANAMIWWSIIIARHSELARFGSKQTFRSAIACPSLSVLTSYSLFGD
jgi:hypothetical protein